MMRLPDEFDMMIQSPGVRWWHCACRPSWEFGPPFSLVSSQGRHFKSHVVAVFFVVVFADEFDMSETVLEFVEKLLTFFM